MTVSPPPRPNVAAYTDFRAYLRDMVVFLKATRRGFSYRAFSRAAGFSSPNFLKRVADGERNMSPDSIPRFARGLGLQPEEVPVFEDLVRLGQARTDDERNRAWRRLRRAGGAVSKLASDQYDLFSQWFVPVLHELVTSTTAPTDPERIARLFFPRIRTTEARKGLALLERLGMIEADDEGEYVPKSPHWSTGPTVRSLSLRNFHRAMLGLAAKALDSVPQRSRNITSLTVALDEAGYQQACELIAEMRKGVLGASSEAAQRSGERNIYQFVFAGFPVTRGIQDES